MPDPQPLGPSTGNINPESHVGSGPQGPGFYDAERLLEAHEANLSHLAYPQAVFGDRRFTRGIVALRFDDSETFDTTVVGPELLSRHLPATFGVIWGRMNTGAPYQDTAAVLALQKQGCEIACHTRSHSNPVLQADPWAFFLDEVETVRNEMRAVGLNVDSWIQPGTWIGDWTFDQPYKLTPAIHRVFRRNYAAATGYITQNGPSYGLPAPFMSRYGVGMSATLDTLTLAQAKVYVDQAVDNGAACTFTCHSYNIGQPTFMSLADFQALLDYIRDRRDDGRIDVMTIAGAHCAQRGTPVQLLADPGFELSTLGGAVYPGWKTTGAPAVIAGRTGGNALQVGVAGVKDAFQVIRGDNLRIVSVDGYAKSAVGAAASNCRVIVQVRGPGNENYDPANICVKTLPADNTWQRIQGVFGVDARAATVKIWLATNGSTNDCAFDDLVIRSL